ncbi:MAG: invasin domain 3-containing protein [Candidatus Zipacnadales bacterium]
MSRLGTCRSRVAIFLCVVLVSSLVFPGFSASELPKEPDEQLHIAVGACTGDGGSGLAEASASLERALRKALANQAAVRVVGLEEQPDRVLSAHIASLTTEQKKTARIQVLVESVEPTTGRIAYRAMVAAEGAVRPAEELIARVDRAIEAVAEQIAAQVTRAETIQGHVIGTPAPGVIVLDVGSSQGITVGSELEVIRDGEVLGKIRVERVAENTATGRLHETPPGAQIRASDEVRVTSLQPEKAATKLQKGKHRNRTATVAGIVIAAGLLVALLSGGGGGGGNDQLTLVAADSSIPADGVSQTTITANLRDVRGRALPDGVMVRFETTLGMVSPANVPLSNGQAQTTLTSSQTPGRAIIRAFAREVQARTTVVFTEVAGQEPAATISVISDTRELPADGASTTTITAVIADRNGNPVADGTEVKFTTTLGLVTPAFAVTQAGVAQATLRAGTEAGNAKITARVGSLSDSTRVQFIEAGDAGNRTLYLTRSRSSVPADGQSTVEIQAIVKNASNNPVADGTLVQFTATAGTIFPARAATVDGVATATLRSDTTEGKAVVRARVGQLTARTVIQFVGGEGTGVQSIFLTRTPAEIPGDGISTSQIVAVVRGPNNTPVVDETPVVFTTSRGLITPSIALTTNGQAKATLQSEPTSSDVTATVTAHAGSQQAVTTVKFTGTGGGPTQINLIADRTNIPADRESTVRMRATITDNAGQPVANTEVLFATTAGRLQPVDGTGWQSQVTVRTNNQGVAEVLLRSTLQPNTATVTARAPSVTQDVASVTVAFTSLVISDVTANPASVPVGGNKSAKVTASIVDTIGNPAPNGTPIEFSIVNQAQLPSATITQSASTVEGVATAIFRSGTEVGTARIRVTIPSVGASNDQTIIGITAGPPALMTLAASQFVASARDLDDATDITALVSDQFDNPVEDGTVVRFDVTPDAGGVITGTGVTKNGFASAKLYTTGWVGDVQVIASTTGEGGVRIDNSTRPLVIHMGGAPLSVRIISPDASAYSAADPYKLYTEADQQIVVQLLDSSGGPADPNAEVTFQLDRGSIIPDPAPITAPLAGTVTATFRSDQPTPAGKVDRIIAVSEGVISAPLFIFIELNPGV